MVTDRNGNDYSMCVHACAYGIKTNANITVHCFSRYLILCICGHRVILFCYYHYFVPILCESNNGVGLTKNKNRSIVYHAVRDIL